MQLVSCYVNLAGDLRHVVWKERVSVAEVLVLRGIHGDDAVTKIKPVGGASGHAIGAIAEKERLIDIYGRKPNGEGRQLIEKLYPGFNPRMPATLKDIGVTEFDDEESPAAAAAGASPVHALSPGKAGGPSPLAQAPDAHDPTPDTQPASSEVGSDDEDGSPDPDYSSIPAQVEPIADEPGVSPRSGLRVPGLTVT